MTDRINISSKSPWEDEIGYCRAVRIGNLIEVSGTTAMDGDNLIGMDNMYEQTKFIIQKIEKALLDVSSSLKDVIRTRMYVTNIDLWQEAGRAHGEFFKKIKPAATMVEVSKLISPGLLIEIEVTAVVQD
ncbi:MAG: RidA family protein [Sphingobacteriales bacterium]|nr:RidA family protein [Sphingobacteriales bacterium]